MKIKNYFWLVFIAVVAGVLLTKSVNGKESNIQNEPVIVMFSAPYCYPCQIAKKDLKEAQKSGALDGIRVTIIDVTKNPKFARSYNITSTPTFIVGLIKIRVRTHNVFKAIKDAIKLRNEKN